MDLMTVTEASQYLRIPEGTLRYWRHRGEGPRAVKLGRRVVYRRQDLDAWFVAQLDASQPQPAS
ncbi:MAG TPA: helix-turn-helix domain-containing protein [Candidatus Janibacter merdipullorum]|nr:helix-turn-helix domain-containing protein [Candidatus Janibacter merdipullorum]